MKFSLLKLKVLAGLGAGLLMFGAMPVPNVSAVELVAESAAELGVRWEDLFSNNADKVRAAINAGFGVNSYRYFGYTPLTSAVMANNLEIVRVLLDAGADPNLQDPRSISTALHHAAEKGNLGIVEFLLDAGAEVNAPGAFRKTPLHIAIESGHAEIANFLVSRGADTSARDSYNHTPFEYLLASNH